MRTRASTIASICAVLSTCAANLSSAGERRLNNLVSELLAVSSISGPSQQFTFTRSSDGWTFVSFSGQGKGTARLVLDNEPAPREVTLQDTETGFRGEAMRFVVRGEHTLKIACQGAARAEKLVVRAIPELIHCGLGFNPAIKSYGLYDLAFLSKDILPNVTTLVVPHNISLTQAQIEDWHGQGKRFVAEVGINPQAKTPEEHFKYWTGFYDQAPFLDGIIINEFIVNRPVIEWVERMTPERLARMDEERKQYEAYEEAIEKIGADGRYKNKTLYAYVGGSGKKLNQEIIGTNASDRSSTATIAWPSNATCMKCRARRVPGTPC
jgi:hypothetical protein